MTSGQRYFFLTIALVLSMATGMIFQIARFVTGPDSGSLVCFGFIVFFAAGLSGMIAVDNVPK